MSDYLVLRGMTGGRGKPVFGALKEKLVRKIFVLLSRKSFNLIILKGFPGNPGLDGRGKQHLVIKYVFLIPHPIADGVPGEPGLDGWSLISFIRASLSSAFLD